MKKYYPLLAVVSLIPFGLPCAAQVADTTQIGAAQVTAYRPVAQLKNGALVTTVENTPLAKVGSAEDVLQQIPGIVKKNDEAGTIEVIGKGAPLIFINGRQVRDLAELKQLRSEEIKAVELIETPGARYDASVNAVVRIRTVRRKGEGFGLDASQEYRQGTYANSNSQLKLTYRKNNLEVFAGFNAWVGKSFWNSTIDQYTAAPDTLWTLPLGEDSRNKKTYLKGNAGFNYEWGKGNSAGVRYEVWRDTRDKVTAGLTSTILANGVFYDELTTHADATTDCDPQHSLNAYYTGQWGKGTFTIDADFVAGGNTTTTHTLELSQEQDDRDFTTTARKRNRLIASKTQYEWPWLAGKVAVGGQYTFTNRHDDYLIPDNGFGISASRSRQRESTAAAFMEYSATFAKRWNVSAGLRYEHAQYNYWQNEVKRGDLSPTYDNLFPSLSLATAFGQGQNAVQLMLSYTSKTQRPYYNQLSNNVTYANRFLQKGGNPELKPTLTHNVNATAVWKILQASIDFTRSKDGILVWGESLPGNPAVTKLSPINHNYSQLQASLTVAPHFGIYRPQWTVVCIQSYLKMKSLGEERNFNSPFFYAYLNNVLQFRKGWNFALIYRFGSPGNYQNMRIDNCTHYLETYLTKSFLHDALTVNIGGADLLYKQVPHSILNMAMSHIYQVGEGDTRQFYLKLSYQLNASRSKYKGQSAAEEVLRRL